jgi:phospholipase/carboxylesterase
MVLNTNVNENQSPTQGCIIWMHGLGADASDMAGLAAHPSIAALPFTHIFIDAPVRPVTINAGMKMRAWYDIIGFELSDREDKEGILQSQAQIFEVINAQLNAGFQADQIMLAGFSQGGAMALRTALHCNLPLAGVIALSAYLPLALECNPVLSRNTPIFLGLGQFDPVVIPQWTEISARWLAANDYTQITLQQYPMEHAICSEEINDVASWLLNHLKRS